MTKALLVLSVEAILFAGCGTTDQPSRPVRAQTCTDATLAARTEATRYVTEQYRLRPADLQIYGGTSVDVVVRGTNDLNVDLTVTCNQGHWGIEAAEEPGS